MTITLHWWMVPLILIIAGLVVGCKQQRDYDFVTPIISLALIFGAICVVVGHFI